MKTGLILVGLVLAWPHGGWAGEQTRARLLMGTVLEIQAVAPAGAMAAAFDEVARLDRLWSDYKPQSELSRLNQRGQGPVSLETKELLAAALEIARKSEGAFNPALGAVSRAWRGGKAPLPNLRPRGWREIQLHDQRVSLGSGDLRLDLGGIGKGAALDRALESLRRLGAEQARLSFGGSSHRFLRPKVCRELRLAGPTGRGHRLHFAAASVSTSANQGSFKGRGETAQGHLIDPWQGRPFTEEEAPWSATVVGPSGRATDAWATAMAVLGPEQGAQVARKQGIIVVWLGQEGEVLGRVGPWQVGPRLLSLAPCTKPHNEENDP